MLVNSIETVRKVHFLDARITIWYTFRNKNFQLRFFVEFHLKFSCKNRVSYSNAHNGRQHEYRLSFAYNRDYIDSQQYSHKVERYLYSARKEY